jgi:hypothetical protein
MLFGLNNIFFFFLVHSKILALRAVLLWNIAAACTQMVEPENSQAVRSNIKLLKVFSL